MAAKAAEGAAGVAALERGPFVLRQLLDNIPLSADGTEEDIRINCVDYYGEILGGLPQKRLSALD